MVTRRKNAKQPESLGDFEPMQAIVPVYKKTTNEVDVGVFQIYPDAVVPEYATEFAACFDLSAHLAGESTVQCFNRLGHHQYRSVSVSRKNGKLGFYVEPQESVLVPTGLIFDIPEGWQIQLNPRSGIALKQHIWLVNSTGIVDADYVKQTYIAIYNGSNVRQEVFHGERLCQAEILPVYRAKFNVLGSAPEKKTSRDGGFGHTGK